MGDPAVTVCFAVQIDGVPLGSFTSCEGIGCSVAVDSHEEGGENGFVYRLPGRVSFSNIKLTRPVDEDSTALAIMMTRMATFPSRHTACIQAMTLDGSIISVWNLDRAFPVKWTGPQLNSDGPKVATETLELAHHGFLPDF